MTFTKNAMFVFKIYINKFVVTLKLQQHPQFFYRVPVLDVFLVQLSSCGLDLEVTQ